MQTLRQICWVPAWRWCRALSTKAESAVSPCRQEKRRHPLNSRQPRGTPNSAYPRRQGHSGSHDHAHASQAEADEPDKPRLNPKTKACRSACPWRVAGNRVTRMEPDLDVTRRSEQGFGRIGDGLPLHVSEATRRQPRTVWSWGLAATSPAYYPQIRMRSSRALDLDNKNIHIHGLVDSVVSVSLAIFWWRGCGRLGLECSGMAPIQRHNLIVK